MLREVHGSGVLEEKKTRTHVIAHEPEDVSQPLSPLRQGRDAR